METIIYYFRYYHYTNLLLMLATLVSFILSYKHRNKIPEFTLFYIYPLASFTQQLISIISPLFPESKAKLLLLTNNLVINSFIGFETIFLMLFYFSVLRRNTIVSKIISFLAILFLLSFLLAGIYSSYTYNNKYVYTFGSLTLIISSLLYFYHLFHAPATSDILKQPTFWISCSVLLTFGCLVPITIVLDEISNDPSKPFDSSIYSITYILYSFLFILISKAFTCQITNKH